jgi:CheY-like chemotaxis protein
MPAPDRRVLKYLMIAMDLRDRIAKGNLKPGQQLPASANLAKEYGVALMTVRQALAVLEHEGIVEARHGAGTFVVQGQRAAVKPRGRGRVLITEDDQALSETLAAALRQAGYEADCALTGSTALEQLRGDSLYDAIVLDLRLPDMSGLEIVEYIKHNRPMVQLIVASGYLEQEEALRTAERWPLMMLRKPYSVSDLLERLEALSCRRAV